MRIGVVFPTNEMGSDPDDIRRYIDAVTECGYDHLLVYDHVVGADITDRPGWPGPYTYRHEFHEPFTLLAYLAGICSLGLMTGVLVLPQRQTVLVAKQSAQVDILTGGRFRLGVGLGWNWVEYEALGRDFATRAARYDDQIELLRALWTSDLVRWDKHGERVWDAGIAPLPVQRPIPVWLSGAARPAVLRRVARLGDGWMPLMAPTDALLEARDEIRRGAEGLGRDADAIGLQSHIPADDADRERIGELGARWRRMGATHLAVNTMGSGLNATQHIEGIRAAAAVLIG